SRALDRCMPAQRDHAAAGAAHVPKELLDDGRGADVLHADRVLRPADGVDERSGVLASARLHERFAHVEELLDGAATRLRDELGRVALVVGLQDLEDAAWMREVGILRRRLTALQSTALRAVA